MSTLLTTKQLADKIGVSTLTVTLRHDANKLPNYRKVWVKNASGNGHRVYWEPLDSEITAERTTIFKTFDGKIFNDLTSAKMHLKKNSPTYKLRQWCHKIGINDEKLVQVLAKNKDELNKL